MLLSDVRRLSVTYIGRNSRTERPRKTKIGTEVAHVTRDWTPLYRSKGQRSRSPGRFGWLYWQANMDIVTYPCAYMTYTVLPFAGLGGAYRGGRLPTACFVLNFCTVLYS